MNAPESTFLFVGNNIAADFVNTELVVRGERVDRLSDPDDLKQWAKEATLPIDSKVGQVHVRQAHYLRSALSEAFTSRIANESASPEALEAINQHMVSYATRQVLRFKDGAYTVERASGSFTAPMLLESLAHEGATLLASPQAERLKQCSSPDCVLIFVDTSRSQKRRWCSMEICGNRAKVSKHYQKQQSQRGGQPQ